MTVSQRADGLSAPTPLRARIVRRSKRIAARSYLELNHDLDRGILVAGSGRSGTTWVAEMLARALRLRVVFEPFHAARSPLGQELRLFVPPHEPDERFEHAVTRVLCGDVHAWHLDVRHPVRFPRGRVIKDVHVMNALPWIRQRFPSVPAVLLLRHPLAVAASKLRGAERAPEEPFQGLATYLETPKGRAEFETEELRSWLAIYDAHAADEDVTVRYVAEWCMENVYATTLAPSFGLSVVYYEDIVRDPWHALAPALGLRFDDPRAKTVDAERPSATDWFTRARVGATPEGRTELVAGWVDEIPRESVVRAMAVVAEFGLDRLYGVGPAPLAGASA